MKSRPIVMPDLSSPSLTEAPINPNWIISGEPRARLQRVVKSDDRTVWYVLWDCTSGVFRWHYNEDENFVVTAGEVFITNDGEPERHLRPGDMAYCPPGSSCTWRVPNYVKKIAVLRGSLPVPVSLFARAWHRLMSLYGAHKTGGLSSAGSLFG